MRARGDAERAGERDDDEERGRVERVERERRRGGETRDRVEVAGIGLEEGRGAAEISGLEKDHAVLAPELRVEELLGPARDEDRGAGCEREPERRVRGEAEEAARGSFARQERKALKREQQRGEEEQDSESAEKKFPSEVAPRGAEFEGRGEIECELRVVRAGGDDEFNPVRGDGPERADGRVGPELRERDGAKHAAVAGDEAQRTRDDDGALAIDRVETQRGVAARRDREAEGLRRRPSGSGARDESVSLRPAPRS